MKKIYSSLINLILFISNYDFEQKHANNYLDQQKNQKAEQK
jgi:hypothetical protein